MAGSDRPPEQVIRDWLGEHGSVTVGLGALEQTWDLPRLDAGDRRRIARALDDVGIVVDPPLGRVSTGDSLTLSLRPEPEPALQPAAAPVRPAVAATGIVAADFRDIVDDTFVEPAWGLYVTAAGATLLVALSMSLLVRQD